MLCFNHALTVQIRSGVYRDKEWKDILDQRLHAPIDPVETIRTKGGRYNAGMVLLVIFVQPRGAARMSEWMREDVGGCMSRRVIYRENKNVGPTYWRSSGVS